jgi:hypothetical protein
MKTGAQEVDFDVPGRTKPCPPHCVAAAKLAERSVLTGSSVAPAAYRRVRGYTDQTPAVLSGTSTATDQDRDDETIGTRVLDGAGGFEGTPAFGIGQPP